MKILKGLTFLGIEKFRVNNRDYTEEPPGWGVVLMWGFFTVLTVLSAFELGISALNCIVAPFALFFVGITGFLVQSQLGLVVKKPARLTEEQKQKKLDLILYSGFETDVSTWTGDEIVTAHYLHFEGKLSEEEVLKALGKK